MADELDFDIETPETIHRRFDLRALASDPSDATMTMTMPVAAAGISNHFGVASAGLELAASAAVNRDADTPLRTASVRVNFLRPFFAGADSRYVGTVLRVGKGTAVGDATAVGDDGKPALVARITAYR